MKDVLAQADLLGKAIIGNERYQRLAAVRQQVFSDEKTRKLFEEYEAITRSFEEQRQSGRPISPHQKERMSQVETQIRQNELVQQFLRAQADFTELVNKVYRTLESALQPPHGK
ncbi:MAG: YlbF family regulator [Planctomycetes bacterium]|nr:YlbF family regulator [Planctomycetota bacterium]